MQSPTIQAALILTFFFVLSLIGAYIVLRILKGTAVIKHKGVQLGGSAAMFVVMFILLNKYLPDIRLGILEETAAAQPIETITEQGIEELAKVVIRPSTQILTSTEFRRLDRNKYDIHEDLGVAIPRVSAEIWHRGSFDSLPVISVSDIPAMRQGMNIFQSVYPEKKPAILGVRTLQGQKITLKEKSSINKIRTTFNWFNDQRFFRSVLKAQFSQMIEMGTVPFKNIDEIPEAIIEDTRKKLASLFNDLLKRKIPIDKTIYSGVYIMPILNEFFQDSIFQSLHMSILDNSLTYVALSGLFGAGGNANLFVDQRRKIASFNASVSLSDVEIEGKSLNLILNNIGFITAGTDRAYFVLLVFPSTDGLQVFQELEEILDGLRFYG